MRRPIVRLAAAYAAGCVVGAVVAPPPSAAAVAGVLAASLTGRLGPAAYLGGAVALGAGSAALGAARREGECASVWPAGDRAAILRIGDAPGARGIASGRVLHDATGCGGTVRLRLDSGLVASGATVVAVGVVRANGVLRVDRVRDLGRRRPARFVIRDGLRSRIARLYGARSPVVDAVVLGYRGDLDPELRHRFVAGGIAHLLAISGLHVGILAGWVLIVLRLVARPTTAWIAGAAVTWAYVALLGFPVSAVRAALFITIACVSRVRERRPPPEVVLALAVFVLLLAEPMAVTSVGAWLSVAAVWGTVTASRLRGGTGLASSSGRVRSPVADLLGASVGATVATSPITALVFGNVAPVGVISNLVAVPLAAVAVPGVVASLAGGPTLAGGAGLALAGIEWVGAAAAAVPGGHLTGEPGVRFAAPWMALLAAAMWSTWRFPGWRRIRRRLLAAVAAASWIGAGLPSLTRLHAPGVLALYVLDVGQGDAIALRTPGGRWALVDAGPRTPGWDAGERVVVPFFRRMGVSSLDLVVVSHGDADHLGGVPAVIDALSPRMVVEPAQPLGTELYQEFLGAIDGAGVEWRAGRAGDTVVLDSVVLAILHPTARWMREHLDANENSLVVRVSYGAFDALLTGDVGWPVESLLVGGAEPVEVLKVAHHGSRGGTRASWVEALRPRVAAISVGRGNRYGHPAPEVVSLLDRHDVTVYRTDVAGTVTIRSDGDYVQVTQTLDLSLLESVLCLLPTSLPSSVSSSSRNACTRTPPGSSPTFFTTSPSPPR